jgi:hypothetical protein
MTDGVTDYAKFEPTHSTATEIPKPVYRSRYHQFALPKKDGSFERCNKTVEPLHRHVNLRRSGGAVHLICGGGKPHGWQNPHRVSLWNPLSLFPSPDDLAKRPDLNIPAVSDHSQRISENIAFT